MLSGMTAVALRPDIAAAYARVHNDYGMKRELATLAEWVEPDERVDELAGGALRGTGDGLLVLTDRRIVFVFRGLVTSALREFHLGLVTSIGLAGGLVFSTINLTVAGASQAIGNVDKTDADRMVRSVRAAVGALQPTSRQVLDLVARLSQLHDAGALTDAEFTAKKTELLSRL